MDELSSLCKEKGVYLLEDYSHAYEAKFKNQKVGTFGDAAMWGLQGQKLLLEVKVVLC